MAEVRAPITGEGDDVRANRVRATQGRSRFERGATMVEYVLIVSFVVFGGLVAIRFLTAEGAAEVADQADCVSTRPPPPSCIRPIVSTTTTVVAPSTSTTEAPTTTTTTTAPPTTTTPPTTTGPTTTTAAPSTTTTAAARFNGSASWRGEGRAYSTGNNGRWYARAPLRIRDAQNRNVRNAVVVVRWTIIDPSGGGSGTAECTTGGNGRCTLRAPSGNSSFAGNVETIRLEIITINGLGAPGGTATQDIDEP